MIRQQHIVKYFAWNTEAFWAIITLSISFEKHHELAPLCDVPPVYVLSGQEVR
jgi:hypothetical protein